MGLTYRLTVYRVETICWFDLTWGQGQRLTARLPYPPQLTSGYEKWQRAYLGYYKTAWRGRSGATGQVSLPETDWSALLAEAETELLLELRRWLRSEALYELCNQLRKTHQPGGQTTIFLTCEPLQLSRLPWEAWDLDAEVGAPIAIVRTAANIRAESAPRPTNRRGKPRMLVIWGEDSDLDMARERSLLRQHEALFDRIDLRRHPTESIPDLKQRICDTIADPQGWDVLFFFGHSNEAALVGGHIAVAPGATLTLKELSHPLQTAQARGLQFALFNSCSGLTIAQTLIELGLNQVVIMREPIHNRVAQTLLTYFLDALSQGLDVQVALAQTCEQLKTEALFHAPAAYLIPSLFCYPETPLFHLEPQGWRATLQRLLPTRRQAIALGLVVGLSLWPGAQQRLLAGRLLAQAIYRQLTLQIPQDEPPVTLIAVDSESIRRSPLLSPPNPINRQYLASLVAALEHQGATVIGIDYLLDRPHPKDPQLAAALQKAVGSGGWLVLATHNDTRENRYVPVHPGVVNGLDHLEGYVNTSDHHMVLPSWLAMCYEYCPFTYWLALVQRYHQTRPVLQPRLDPSPSPPLSQRLLDAVTQLSDDTKSDAAELQRVAQLQLSGLASEMKTLGQYWFYPILDFSLPPDRIFKSLPAHQLLDQTQPGLPVIDPETVVILGAGGYAEAGVDSFSDDQPLPLATAYWRRQALEPDFLRVLPKLEANAYRVHHLLAHHLVLPVPDLWLVGLALGVGKGTALGLQNQKRLRRHGWVILIIGTATWGLISAQIFVSAQLLVPVVLPTATVWIYTLPLLWRQHSYG
jgi:hypothetical protein